MVQLRLVERALGNKALLDEVGQECPFLGRVLEGDLRLLELESRFLVLVPQRLLLEVGQLDLRHTGISFEAGQLSRELLSLGLDILLGPSKLRLGGE